MGVACLQMDGMMIQTREEGWKKLEMGSCFQRTKKFNKLSKGKLKEVIAFLEKKEQKKEVADYIRYFTNNQTEMNYKLYKDQGLDIGSEVIENTHRSFIQSRMKQVGMHWKKKIFSQ